MASVDNKIEHRRSGLWVVFLGPDGAGKSAVIERLSSWLAKDFVGCNSYHLRPTLFRNHTVVVNRDPHEKAARTFIVTMTKLFYLLAANWVAYFAVVRRRQREGTLVMYDRHFADCLVDPRRYRLPRSSMGLARCIAQFMPEPNVWIVMDVPADILQERKPEVSLAESERQRTGYLRFAASRRRVYVVNAAQPLSLVVEAVVSCIRNSQADFEKAEQAV